MILVKESQSLPLHINLVYYHQYLVGFTFRTFDNSSNFRLPDSVLHFVWSSFKHLREWHWNLGGFRIQIQLCSYSNKVRHGKVGTSGKSNRYHYSRGDTKRDVLSSISG